jgi:hypothetical protein
LNGPFCLVANPAAGRGRSLRALAAATAALDSAAARYQASESGSLDHAREIAARAAGLGHVVVAVGGDGGRGPVSTPRCSRARGRGDTRPGSPERGLKPRPGVPR